MNTGISVGSGSHLKILELYCRDMVDNMNMLSIWLWMGHTSTIESAK